jgi:hypothetical protein
MLREIRMRLLKALSMLVTRQVLLKVGNPLLGHLGGMLYNRACELLLKRALEKY